MPVTAGQPASGTNNLGVSVVIPTFNYARFVGKAVDSVLRQSHPRIEIIVVDDGSTDDTRQVLAAYGEEVRYLYQPNAGLSAARNTGIRAASHEYIALLDSDDEWTPRFVAKALEVLASLPPGYGMVVTPARYIDADSAPLPGQRDGLELEGEITAADILFSSRFPSNGILARRQVFDTCGLFETGLQSSEDRDMWIRVGARYRIQMLPESMALVRRHGQSMISNVERMKSSMRSVIARAYAGHVVPHWRFWTWLKVLGVFHFQTALMYSGQHRLWPAFCYVARSLLCWPLWFSSRELNTSTPLVRLRLLVNVCLKSLRGIFAK